MPSDDDDDIIIHHRNVKIRVPADDPLYAVLLEKLGAQEAPSDLPAVSSGGTESD